MGIKNSKIAFIILCVIVTVVYLPSLNNHFTNWDDDIFLLNNPLVLSLSPSNIHRIFTTTIHASYIPLTILSFAVEHHFFGFNAMIFHLNSLFLHIMTTGLVYLCALYLGLSITSAFFAALLFGVHPMHVESVAWISERKDVLYSVFYMLSIIFYCRYLTKEKRLDYIYSILLALLSILAKPMALSLPLVLFLMDWMFKRKFDLKTWLLKIPYFFIIIPTALITYMGHARIPGKSMYEGVLIWLWTSTFYLKKFFLPLDLSPVYLLPKPIQISNWNYLLAILIFLVVITSVLVWRRNKVLLFAFGYYILSIFFLFKYDQFEAIIVADRYMYLPSVGFCILIGVLLERFFVQSSMNKNIKIGIIGGLFLILSIMTIRLINVWHDPYTLWNYVVHKAPQSPIAYLNRGVLYKQAGLRDKALADFNQAIANDQNYLTAYISRGNLYSEEGNYQQALLDLTQAIKINPSFYGGHYNRGNVFAAQKSYDLAIVDYNNALAIKPNAAMIYYARSLVYKYKKDFDQAYVDANKAKALGFQYLEEYIQELENIIQSQKREE